MLNVKQRTTGFALACLLVLCAFGGIVMEKEQLIANGRTVLLELAPADPRSLMQGDYMRLRYKEARDMLPRGDQGFPLPRRGYAVMAVDGDNVARYRRIYNGVEKLQYGEFLLRFHARYGGGEFVPDSFFFQEGMARDFQPARYGIFKVGDDGKSVLTGLAGEDRVKIEPKIRMKTEF